jgi:hypothetical protein
VRTKRACSAGSSIRRSARKPLSRTKNAAVALAVQRKADGSALQVARAAGAAARALLQQAGVSIDER